MRTLRDASFVKHGDDLRYSAAFGWRRWDGKIWCDVHERVLVPLVTETVKATIARLLASGADADEVFNEGRAYLRRARIDGVLYVASGILFFDDSHWNGYTSLLTCSNGTVDLLTGTLGPHRREHYATHMSPNAFDPDARSEVFDEFLRETTAGNGELQAFLQRAFGYSLTGDTGEEVLFFVHGPEAAGKSTLLEAVRAALSTYSRVIDFKSLLEVQTPRRS